MTAGRFVCYWAVEDVRWREECCKFSGSDQLVVSRAIAYRRKVDIHKSVGIGMLEKSWLSPI